MKKLREHFLYTNGIPHLQKKSESFILFRSLVQEGQIFGLENREKSAFSFS